MTKGKKTTFEERAEIVQYCIAHDRNYIDLQQRHLLDGGKNVFRASATSGLL